MQSPATLRRRAATHLQRPADYRDDLPGQAEFLAARTPRVIWFGFNGGGKTEALVRRCIRVFEGTDVICSGVTRPLVMLLCVTGYDAVSCRDFARQLHDLAPAGLLAQVDLDEYGNPIGRASEWYGAAKGFRGRPPRLVVQRGPMKGTTLNLTTLGSGQGAAAGGTIDVILINEPESEAVVEELATRDRAGSLGYLWYVLTPIPDAPSQVYLERSEEGPGLVERWGATCTYIRTELTQGALAFPSGRRLEPWAKTEARISGWSPITRPMRMGISLEPILEGAFFAGVWRDSLVVDEAPDEALYLVGNLDHGLIEGRMRVGVTGFRVSGPPSARRLSAWDLIDLRGSDARVDQMAEVFLRALDTHGIPLDAIDEWIGDRAIVANSRLVRRDNHTWRGAVLSAVRRRAGDDSLRAPRSLWDIRTPRKRSGSNVYLMEQLRSAMAEDPPRLRFLRHCALIQEDVQRWDGRRTSPNKDGLDRLGYAWEAAHRHYGLWRS